jgi:hypothetical protein
MAHPMRLAALRGLLRGHKTPTCGVVLFPINGAADRPLRLKPDYLRNPLRRRRANLMVGAHWRLSLRLRRALAHSSFAAADRSP